MLKTIGELTGRVGPGRGQTIVALGVPEPPNSGSPSQNRLRQKRLLHPTLSPKPETAGVHIPSLPSPPGAYYIGP